MASLKDKLLGTGSTSAMVAGPAGAMAGVAGIGAGVAVSTAGKAIDQSINVFTSNIDVGQIIKYAIYAAILFGVCILILGCIRELIIGVEVGMCDVSAGFQLQDGADCIRENMSAFKYAILWDIEWYMRAFLFLSVAVILSGTIYSWAKWLMDKLLRIDLYIKQIEDWIFGFSWEGRAESGETLETKF